MPTGVCVSSDAGLVFPGGRRRSGWRWRSSLVATYILVTPVAAMLSRAFARDVDMNSIGRGSNAHGLATLLGAVACARCGAPVRRADAAGHACPRRPTAAGARAGAALVRGRIRDCPPALRAGRAGFDRRRESLALLI